MTHHFLSFLFSLMPQVLVNVYDLSQGIARQQSMMILGKQIDAIYHTGVVVFGREIYFGSGICTDPVGHTPYGTPMEVRITGNDVPPRRPTVC